MVEKRDLNNVILDLLLSLHFLALFPLEGSRSLPETLRDYVLLSSAPVGNSVTFPGRSYEDPGINSLGATSILF